MLSVRVDACARRTSFRLPEPHLRAGFLWWEWQSVPSLQKLHSRCSASVLYLIGYKIYLYILKNIFFKSEFLKLISLLFSGVVAQRSEIWFLDRSLCWHFLTTTFTSYYRLMITHLGLPEWQYHFTPYGPSPQAKVVKVSNPFFSEYVL